MRYFSDAIEDLQLMDLPLHGVQYTWSRREDIFQASRIDRFLVSTEWNESFRVVKQLALPRVISYHKPLLLESGEWDSTTSYFKFENMWLQRKGFIDMVKGWWQNYTISGNPDFVLIQKLRSLKKDISKWNKEVYDMLDTKRSRALDELLALEQATESRAPTQVEKQRFLTLRMELEEIAKAEEISWRQNSRCLWLKEGDVNTKYFQSLANSFRRCNSIDKLKINNEITEDKELIKGEILNYYQALYTEKEEWRPSSNFEDVARVLEEESELLEKGFEEDEVYAIIQSCAPDKAPGPDGFTMAFFPKSWDFIKPEIMEALNHFHQHCYMERSCNASFMPKKNGRV